MIPSCAAACTPGPWYVQPGYLTIYALSQGDVGETCAIAKVLRDQLGNEQAEANAELFAEAGTVKHETGLTPRQLAEQRAELLGVIERAEAWIGDMPHGENCYLSAHYDGDPGNQCNCGKESLLDALQEAIAKATGGSK